MRERREAMRIPLLLLAAVVALLLLAGVLWWTSDSVRKPTRRNDAGELTAVARVGALQSPPSTEANETRAAETARVAIENTSQPSDLALHGRCLDPEGRPLRDVAITVTGNVTTPHTQGLFELEFGTSPEIGPFEMLTAADGRFATRLALPGPLRLFVRSSAPGHVPIRVTCDEVHPDAASLDLGDLELEPGWTISGRVVDETGQPIPDAVLHARGGRRVFEKREPIRTNVGRIEVLRVSWGFATTNSQGYFDHLGPLAHDDDFELLVDDHEVLSPEGRMSAEETPSPLEVVVRPETLDTSDTISGTVFAANGTPVAHANLFRRVAPPFATERDGACDREGRFILRRQDSDVDQVELATLHVQAPCHEPWTSRTPIAWGTSELAIHLAPGTPLTVRAVRADDGRPVERFGVVWIPVREVEHGRRAESEVREVGDHPGGLVEFPSMTAGRYRVVVVVPSRGGDLTDSDPMEVEVQRGVPAFVTVEVPCVAERWAVVEDGAGEPITGAALQLLRNRDGEPVEVRDRSADRLAALVSTPGTPARVLEGTTNAAGSLLLRGRGGVDHALLIRAGERTPRIVQPVRLDIAEPLRIVLRDFGSVRGHIGPPDVVAQLAAEAGDAAPPQRRGLFVYLVPARGGQLVPDRKTYPDGIRADEAGRFEIHDVPPGEWIAHLRWSVDDGRRLQWSRGQKITGAFPVVASRVHEFVVDLSRWRRTPTTLVVKLNGEPATGELRLETDLPSFHGEFRDQQYHLRTLPASGCVTVPLEAGTWSARLQTEHAGTTLSLHAGPVDVVSGAATTRELAFHSGSLVLLLVKPDGSPAVGVDLLARGPEVAGIPEMRGTSAPSDDSGRTQLVGKPGVAHLYARRQPLLDRAARRAWSIAHPNATLRDAWVDLGPVDLSPTPTGERTIRLPAEWLELPD